MPVDLPIYTSEQRHTDFHIGGIGTGTVSVNAAACLTNFELFNRPAQANKLPYSFFAMHYRAGVSEGACVLEAKGDMDFHRARGFHFHHVKGLPRFARGVMRVEYPFCEVDLEDAEIPLRVRLTAFNPLVPLNPRDSGIPGVVLRYRVQNPTPHPAFVLLCGSMPNVYGFSGFDTHDNFIVTPGVFNREVKTTGFSGAFLGGEGLSRDNPRRADVTLLLDGEVLVKPYWYKGGWQDGVTLFWNDLCRGEMTIGTGGDEDMNSRIGPPGLAVGSVGRKAVIPPGGEETFTFILGWSVPNRARGWFENDAGGATITNDYATRYESSLDAARDLAARLPGLEAQSRLFADALHNSTLPRDVILSCAYSIGVLRSTTCFVTQGGKFWGWEGSHEEVGSCHGTCTHVWNYAQTVAFLFPQLERTARENELLVETEPDGRMYFRSQQAFGLPPFDLPAAVDGQLGVIVRVWREYLLGAGLPFLRRLYPNVLSALSYAAREWDRDGDGLMEACQHNTYDIEFFGANPLSGVLYLAALRAAREMACALGDKEQAETLARLFDESAKALDERCFTGEYYRQLDAGTGRSYQFYSGCLSDQLLGQTMAYSASLGDLLPGDHLRGAAEAIFKYNYSDGTVNRQCLQRLFAQADEPGLKLCSWPHGGEPALPFVYSDEVWTGVEYQVADLLIRLGMVKEGFAIVSSVRSRFDGDRRNPFNEMECGFHYARSMAAYGLINACSGLTVSADGTITFSPAVSSDDFRCFYCDGKSWGILRQTIDATGNKAQWVETLGYAPQETV